MADNIRASEVLVYMVDVDLKPLAAAMFETTTADLSNEERSLILARVAAAVHDPEVSAVLHPPPRATRDTTSTRRRR